MPIAATLIDNPLAGWANDDLLFAEETRAYFAANHATALPVLDWPELRARFTPYDAAANVARRRSRLGGVQAALVGYASLLIGAVAPLAASDDDLGRVLGIAAALLATAATIWGYTQLLAGRRKGEWLTNRYWTERLRQLHFQFILNNLPLATEMMRDPSLRPEWHRRRAAALAGFDMRFVRPVTESFNEMREDDAEEAFWIDEDWRDRSALPPESVELDELFDLLKAQRFAIQKRFATLKSTPGIHSAKTRAALGATISNVLTVFVLAATITGGIVLAAGQSPETFIARGIAAFLGVCSATIILLRVLSEGLQLASEAERYQWYRAAVTAITNRFETSDIAERVELLRDMERLSYQEMRWFLNAFHEAKFII